MFKQVKPLVIMELANNSQGSVDLGIKIIKTFNSVVKDSPLSFAMKVQYRHLDSFIHPDYKDSDLKYIKRFRETRLEDDEIWQFKNEIDNCGLLSCCTPYDEYSVDLLESHKYDIIKIASASLTDWTLLERIVKTDKPIIASVGSASLNDIDNVVSFLEHRNKEFALLHCVAQYPVEESNIQLGQIALLKNRYPNIEIGYSGHENPDDIDTVKIAVGLGATIFERHVGLENLNAYSSSPVQLLSWVKAIEQAYYLIGDRDKRVVPKNDDLSKLGRHIFASTDIKSGEIINSSNTFLAIPGIDGQLNASSLSKYIRLTAHSDIKANAPVCDVTKIDTRSKIWDIVQVVKAFVKQSGVVVPQKVDMEISFHYGIDRFYEFGLVMFTVVNQQYCKKILVMLPHQQHPAQCHRIKCETFNLLYGDLLVQVDDKMHELKVGDVLNIESRKVHSLWTEKGAVIEEISTTHDKNDSYYIDEGINNNKNRKANITFWM